MDTTTTHRLLAATAIGITGASALTHAGPFPADMTALTFGAVATLSGVIACAARAVMTHQEHVIRAIVDERFTPIERNTGRLVAVENEVLRELTHRDNN